MSETQRTLYFVDAQDALLVGRVLRVELHRPGTLPRAEITRTGSIRVDLAATSDSEADRKRDLMGRAPRAVVSGGREALFADLNAARPARAPTAGAKITPMRVPSSTLFTPGSKPVAPGRLSEGSREALRPSPPEAPAAFAGGLLSEARREAHRRALAKAKQHAKRLIDGVIDLVSDDDEEPRAAPLVAAAAGGETWWIEVYDVVDDDRPLQAELLSRTLQGFLPIVGDRFFRVGGGLYWRFREGGLRRALPDPFEAMVHRTADTGRPNGGLMGARDPGWRAAFAKATARVQPMSRPLPGPHPRCILSKDASQTLLKLLAPPARAPEVTANWMRAVLAWVEDVEANDLGEGHFGDEIFAEYLGQLKQSAAPPPDAPEGWWAEAQASWGPRGLFASRPAMLDASAAALEDRLINGMSPHGLAERGEGADRRLLWLRSWDAAHRAPRDGDYALPDVEVVLLPVEGGALPRVESIRLRFPGQGWVETPRPEHEAPEHDAMDDWSQAKRYTRQAILLSGQLDWHVARGHFFMELHLVALCRSLPTHHPLRVQLWPFLRSVDEINEFGEELLFSETGLLVRASGLSAAGVNGRLRAQLRGALSDGRPPRPPSCAGDSFSPWAAVAWRATQKYVEERFTDEVLEDSALSRWAAALLEGLPEGLPELSEGAAPTRADALPEGAQWCEAEAPVAWPPTDRVGWRALVHRLIYHATFLHSYVGHQQFEDGGNPLLAPFGLQRPLAGRRPATWEDVAPKAAHAGLQVGMAELLALPRWGMLCEADEPGSHPAEYGALLALLEAELAAARAALPPGAPDPFARFSTQDIRGRINI